MSNNPLDYFRQFEQLGEQMKNIFGADFMKNFMPNITGMPGSGSQQASGSPVSHQFDWLQGQNQQKYPLVDLYQTSIELVAVIELPGLEKSTDIRLTVEPDRLYIKGIPNNRYTNMPSNQYAYKSQITV